MVLESPPRPPGSLRLTPAPWRPENVLGQLFSAQVLSWRALCAWMTTPWLSGVHRQTNPSPKMNFKLPSPMMHLKQNRAVPRSRAPQAMPIRRGGAATRETMEMTIGKIRKEVKSLLKNGIQTCCRQVENDLDYVTPTTDREKFVIGYLQTKIAHIDPRRSLPITEDRKLWDACMAQWKRQQDCKQTRSCTGRSEFFRAGMCKEPESVPHKQKFKQVNKAYWDHRASERQMSQLWAERNSGEDVGVPSTAGTLVSDQGSLPAPETPPKVTGSMADNERCATTPTLVCCKKDPPMSAVKERTLPKPKRLTIIGAKMQRARRVKAQNKKPSTAGSDQNTVSDHQGGALHCTPNMEDGSDQDGEDPLEFGVLDVS